jgi:hypothetical protein
LAKSRTIHCYICGNSYYVWGKKDKECPFCEETRFKELNPKAYIKWKDVKEKNNDMSRKVFDCNKLFDTIKHSLVISLPILILLYTVIIIDLSYGYDYVKEDLGAMSMALIIGVMLIWAIKIGIIIFSNDHTVYHVWTKGGDYLGSEVGDRYTVVGVILVGIVLIFLLDKYFMKSGTDGYVTRQCVVGFTMFGIESLMTGIKLFLAIKAKVSIMKCRKQIISLVEFKKRYNS